MTKLTHIVSLLKVKPSLSLSTNLAESYIGIFLRLSILNAYKTWAEHLLLHFTSCIQTVTRTTRTRGMASISWLGGNVKIKNSQI